ncbi:hypothetical protein ACTFIW_000379 [Dictyostelium discoideum]
MIKLFNNINKSKSLLCRNDYLVKNFKSLNTNSVVFNKINFSTQTSNYNNNNGNTNKTYITSFNTTSKFNTNDNTNTIEEKRIGENEILELIKSKRFSSYYYQNLSMGGDLCQQSNSWYELLNTENGEKLSNLSILIECINKFPNYPNSYLILASFMKNDNQFIKIKKQLTPSPPSSPSSPSLLINEQFIEVNRNDLISKALKIIRNDSKYSQSDMAQCYIQLASTLDGDELIEFIDYDGMKKQFSKKQLYAKAIEVIENKLIDIPINQLLQIMSSDEKIEINGKLHSIVDLSNIIPQNHKNKKSIVTTYCILSKIFKRDKNIEEYIKFNELFLNEKEKLKKTYIESIQNGSKESINYLNLSLLTESDEKVMIYGKTSYGKVDLLLWAIHYGGKDKNSIEAYYQLSKELPKFNSTIKLLNGTVKTKLEIQMETLSYSPNSLFDYSIHLIDSNSSQNKIKNIAIIDCLKKVLSMDPSFSLAYLNLGIQMQNYSIDECEIPLISFEQQQQLQQQPLIYGKGEIKFTRKQLFMKFLELSKTDFKLNENDILLGWYHLAVEMDSNNNNNKNNNKKIKSNKNEEKVFGKTKKEILLSIIEQDVTFTRAYSELSSILSTETHYDQIIDLMVNSIKFESDVNIKSNQFNKLSQLIKDNNERIKLENEKNMKEQRFASKLEQCVLISILGVFSYLIYDFHCQYKIHNKTNN